jgi:hypothetical protein
MQVVAINSSSPNRISTAKTNCVIDSNCPVHRVTNFNYSGSSTLHK